MAPSAPIVGDGVRQPAVRATRGLVLATLVVAGCGAPPPRELALDRDTCAHCHMIVSDARFGGELVTNRGRVLVFDDAGCLASFLREDPKQAARAHSLWVVDFLEPGRLLPADSAVYLETDRLRSPMSFQLLAARPGASADSLAEALGASRRTWAQVLDRAGSGS